MKESKTNRINLEATSEATEALLKFLYTDELECDTRTVCEVMILSDMYLLDNLKQKCVEQIYDSVTEDSVIEIYAWASKCNIESIITYSEEYIWKKIGVIRRKNEFKQLLQSGSSLII